MCCLHQAYQEHFDLLGENLLYVNTKKLYEEDNLFSKMQLEKAYAYKVADADVIIYSLFAMSPPLNSLGNYLKIPTNRVLLKKFFEDDRAIQKKLSECFEIKLADNKVISKKTKSKFTHYELTNITNSMLMALDIMYYHKNILKTDVYNDFVNYIDEGNIYRAGLSYFLAYLCYTKEDVEKINEYLKTCDDLVTEKLKHRIERMYDFSVDILKLAKNERYELFVDEQLVKMTDYMRAEKENMIQSFESDEQRYLEMIEDLTKRLNNLEKENMELKNKSMKKTSPLNKKKVLVVGDTGRKDSYRKIVEQYGGDFDFIDGVFDKEKISLVSESADIAILVIPRMKHTISNALKINKVPMIFVNNAGISAFEDVVDNYCLQ
jgi:hypothetical protein